MTESELVDLIDLKTETARLDFKERLNWNDATKEEKCKIVKDILAFANYPGGGRIVLGIRDNDFVVIGMNQNEFDSFDITSINNFLHAYSDPVFTCSLQKFVLAEKRLIVLDVPEFSTSPIICKKDFQNNKGENILQKGVLYIRKESAESSRVETVEEMRGILNRALKGRSDEILRDISILLSGSSRLEPAEDIFGNALEAARAQIRANLNEYNKDGKYGEMSLSVKPDIDLTEFNRDVFNLKNRYQASQVAYRGWTFPYLNTNNTDGRTFNIDNGFTTYLNWNRFIESSVALVNGIFMWKHALWEDLTEDGRHAGQKVISFISLIYTSLELVLFINKFYDFSDLKPDVSISLILENMNNRRLVSYDQAILLGSYTAHVDTIVVPEFKFNVVESISNPKAIASKIVRSIFAYFDFQIQDDQLNSWQERFLTKRM